MGTRSVRVLDPDRELESAAGVRVADLRGFDQFGRSRPAQQVEDEVVQLERDGVIVLVDDRSVEGASVELLGPLRVFDEERDGANAARQLGCDLYGPTLVQVMSSLWVPSPDPSSQPQLTLADRAPGNVEVVWIKPLAWR